MPLSALTAAEERHNALRRTLPLTAKQKLIVLSELHLYYSGFYQRGYAYQKPTFAWDRIKCHPDDVPDGASALTADRRGKGTASDPTFAEVVTILYGPAPVYVYVGEREPVDTAVFKRLAMHLPTHLRAAYDFILVGRGRYVDAPEKLRIGRDTASAYAHMALEVVAGLLYEVRWDMGEEIPPK